MSTLIFSFNIAFIQVMLLGISKYAQKPYIQIIEFVLTTYGAVL